MRYRHLASDTEHVVRNFSILFGVGKWMKGRGVGAGGSTREKPKELSCFWVGSPHFSTMSLQHHHFSIMSHLEKWVKNGLLFVFVGREEPESQSSVP